MPRARTIAAFGVTAGLLGAGAPAQAADTTTLPLRPADAKGGLRTERLSDEKRLTRWAHSTQLAWIRKQPDRNAKRIAQMRLNTEDHVPEVYLALESRRLGPDKVWVKVRIPGRPNGRVGWVPRAALGPLHKVNKQLVVSRKTLRATLYRNGKAIFRARVGVGTAKTPTPGGNFYIREKLRGLKGNTIYGPWALGTSAYSVLSDWPGGGIVGIHGTNEPERIPGRPSHGCIRMRNDVISRLAPLVPLGTPVLIK